MATQVASDSRLLTFLQKHLKSAHNADRKLRNVKFCGSQHVQIIAPAVFVVSNQKKSRFTGISRCHSAWSCPVCTAQRMAEYGSRIACALDALETSKYNMSAFMMTLTIPHHKWMDGKDVFEILQKTWRAFSKECTTTRTAQYTLKKNLDEDKRAVGQAGTVRTYTKHYHAPFPNMRKKLGLTHNIRVYEFTWSEYNGWHPHIHALFWLPKKNFDKLNDGWEQKLADSWWLIAEREARNYYYAKFPQHKNIYKSMMDHMFNEYRRTPTTGHKCVYFSKDGHGKVRKISSSLYISGWGGDDELAGHKTADYEGHYTPHQLLETAYKDPTKREQFLNLYVEYMHIVFGKRRVMFSPKTGLKQVIDEWRKTNTWFETLKKKLTVKAGEHPWRVVAWFNDEQWLQIACENLQADILERARLPNARHEIANFLASHNIFVSTKPHHYEGKINRAVFENKIPKGSCDEARIAVENQRRVIAMNQPCVEDEQVNTGANLPACVG